MASFVSNISKKLLPNVAIFSHSDCIEHLIPNHIERPQRVTSILKYLHDNWHSSIFHDSTSITDDQILLFHRLEHLNELKEYFDEAEKKKKIVRYDGDTQVCPRTRSAVLHSGGAIINAIDRMYLPTDDSQWLRCVLSELRESYDLGQHIAVCVLLGITPHHHAPWGFVSLIMLVLALDMLKKSMVLIKLQCWFDLLFDSDFTVYLGFRCSSRERYRGWLSGLYLLILWFHS